jgi:hypothetical protein
MYRFFFLLAIVATLGGCQRPDAEKSTQPESAGVRPTVSTSIRLRDVAPECGTVFTPRTGNEANRFTILESLGSGIATVDIDQDQNLDIIAIGGGIFDSEGRPQGVPHGVFRQRRPWQFDNVSVPAGLASNSDYSHGIAAGDWNGDGFEDLLITGFQTTRLFLNSGDGTFATTPPTGISQQNWSTSAAFLDAENDGDLDFYVVNYVQWDPENNPPCFIAGHRDVCPPGQFEAVSDVLYENLGNDVFQPAATSAGLQPGGKGLAVIAGDVDLDADTDIYVANDTTPNVLYFNESSSKAIKLHEDGLLAGCSLGPEMNAEGSMGVEMADFNQDGLPDIWVSNYENQSFALYECRVPRFYQHVSAIRGITSVGKMFVGFGTVAIDADLDGDEDIFAANGHVMYGKLSKPQPQTPLLFENRGENGFLNVASLTGEYGQRNHMGRGVAVGDMDCNGLNDLVVSHANEPISLLQNESGGSRNWVSLRLIGTQSNRSAIGASARLNGAIKLVTGGGSYLSDSANILNWGLSEVHASEVEVEVFWPSGRKQNEVIRTRQVNTVVERFER